RDGRLNVWDASMVGVAYSIILPNITAACTLATLTYRCILRAKTMSFGLRSTQLKILIAVCAQTFVPIVCVYIPYICVIGSPIFRLPDFGIPTVFPFLVSLFPGWDAVVIITLMKDYRKGLLSLLTPLVKKKKIAVTSHWKSTKYRNLVLGVLLNLLLLYLIRRFSRKDMGNYKYLLTVFAAYDIFLSVIHGILNPVS
ncbi:hypothetical protein PFISCL1PPCAC_13564, partial [Pristionchus fissidentatus]